MARRISKPGKSKRSANPSATPPATPKTPRELPSREEVRTFVREAPGRVGKREIARAFGIDPAQKPELRDLLFLTDLDAPDIAVAEALRAALSRPVRLPRITVSERMRNAA